MIKGVDMGMALLFRGEGARVDTVYWLVQMDEGVAVDAVWLIEMDEGVGADTVWLVNRDERRIQNGELIEMDDGVGVDTIQFVS